MIIALQTLVFFRQSLLSALDRLLSPYYKRLTFTFARHIPEDEEEEQDVYAEFDDEKGVVFFPPMYAQRYAAVTDCLMDERWCGKLEKVVDLGYHDMSFIKYLKEVPGVRTILGVDIETIPLRCSSDLLGCEEYAPIRESPLQVTLFQGNAADPDYRLIGCDAVIAIEMIEHMLPHDLDRLVHNIFGFVKPWVAIFTTPNADFNVLFKSLEKNGLRRLDHFFEWTREQFHDWCSNIVVRYPLYTVSCKGVGPGPPGTHHNGCCSQLALFVNKDYHKQPDLNLNSLALVATVPSPLDVADMYGGWDTPVPVNDTDLVPQDRVESLSDFLYDQPSCMAIVISPSYTVETIEYSDKMSQCNLDTEVGKNFLMFNDEDICYAYDTLMPRRKLESKVYEIEDVNSRLNCTTLSVKKFSKQTQNMMAKHKIDSLVHTREVVSEIQHLTKMLNFRDKPNHDGANIWCNINWGENAPYWNQYYKIIRDYSYPFEAKSEECRILDLISEEINRLIDTEYSDALLADEDKIEIPIGMLVDVVKHITDDVERVKDLLEWNGYEIRDDMVVHSRLIVDHTSIASGEEDWPDNDSISDYNTTDVHSTTISEGSTIVPDYHGRGLRKALDRKVRALRAMLSADEDISTELDRVVCRLMKLALCTRYKCSRPRSPQSAGQDDACEDEDISTELDRVVCRLTKLALCTSKGKQTPPPTKWMQCKLLDLLTLTEKAIARRKRHRIVNCPIKAIGFGQEENESMFIEKLKKENMNVRKIVDKYFDILESEKDDYVYKYHYDDDALDRDVASNATLKDFEFSETNFSQTLDNNFDNVNFEPTVKTPGPNFNRERTQEWIEKDNLEVVAYPEHSLLAVITPSDYSTSNGEIRRYKKTYKRPNTCSRIQEDRKAHKRPHSVKNKLENGNKSKRTKPYLKNVSNSFIKSYKKRVAASDIGNHGLKTKRKTKEHKKLQSTSSKPIPESLINLCQPDVSAKTDFNNSEESKTGKEQTEVANKMSSEIAATEESVLIDIVMDDTEETIALRRSIGTDVESNDKEKEIVLAQNSTDGKNVTLDSELQVKTENVLSQTIFLYDINEPSTSKGVRHVSMDVQCGPDSISPSYPRPSPVSSTTRLPPMLETGIKIGESLSNMNKISGDHDVSTNNVIQNFGPTSSRIRTANHKESRGIKIGDSSTILPEREKSSDFGTSTNDIEGLPSCPKARSPSRRSVGIKIKDSLSNLKNNSDFGTSTDEKEPTCKAFGPRTKGITIRDSFTDMSTGQHFDFGTEMHDSNNLHKNTKLKTTYDNGVSTGDSLTELSARLEFGTNTESSDNIKQSNLKTHSSQTEFSITIKKSSIREDRRQSPKFKFTKGIKSSDYLTGKEKNCRDHKSDIIGGRYRSPSPINRSFGFKIKDEVGNITKCVEYTSTRIEMSDFHTPFIIPIHPTFTTDSKMTDSGSEFYESGCCSSPQRSNLHLTNPSIHACDSQTNRLFSRQAMIDEKMLTSKMLKNNLSCGGLHIHSYKEKHVSEDIVFQGEWQRRSPKIREKFKKPAINTNVNRNSAEPNNKKRKVTPSDKPYLKKVEQKFEVKAEVKKPVQIRTRALKVKQDMSNNSEQKKKYVIPKNRAKTITNKSVIKVSSKVTVSSITSKNTRIIRSAKRQVKQTPKQHIAFGRGSTAKDKDAKKQSAPIYAKKRSTIDKNNLNQSLGAVETVINANKENTCKAIAPTLRRSKTEITTELLKITDEPRENLTYVVFRNELENNQKKSNNEPTDNKTEGTSRRRNFNRRSSSPLSQNSSTCSTPDSIATVKEVSARTKPSARRHCGHSPSSNKSSMGNSDNDAISSVRNRKYKRSKSAKTAEDKCNKENVPESSKKLKSNENLQNVKNAFLGRSKNIFLAQFANESALTLNSKHQMQKSIMQAVDSNDDKKKSGNSSVKVKKSAVHDSFNKGGNENEDEFISEPSNVVLVLGPPLGKLDQNAPLSATTDNDGAVVNTVDNTLLAEWLGNENNSGLINDSTESTILSAMKQIVEDRLDFIQTPSDTSEILDMVSQLPEDSIELELDETCSLKSFQTVITNDDNTDNFKNITDIAFENTFESAQDLPSTMSIDYQTDLDLVSFKSSTSTSKISEYFLADEVDNTLEPEIQNISSIRDIFERKEQMIPKQAGMLAVQAFSGFSMDAEPVAGDQPDYVNLMDSDAGSLAVDIARQATYATFAKTELLAHKKPDQVNVVDSETGSATSLIPKTIRVSQSLEKSSAGASLRPDPVNDVDSETCCVLKSLIRRPTSEELFISGRSSESYESCIIDEDAVVPNWLFNIINQQYPIDIEEEDQPMIGPVPAPPHAEPVYDLNGNVPEAGMSVGAGAGAGDGRGMHSDHSQDSSGRGTSLSSSDASSGQQSEAILIDPSAFTAQFELLHDSIGSSAGVTTLVLPIDASRPEGADTLSTSRDTRITINPTLTVSDGDADVSSLDTDAPDSSDN